MAADLLIGAVLGALIAELLKVMLDLSERTIHFNPVLKDIRIQLESLSNVIKQLDELSIDFLSIFPENTNYLREQINKGKQLILKCDAVQHRIILKYLKAPFYTRKLCKLDVDLQRAETLLSLQLQTAQNKQLNMLSSNCRCRLHSQYSTVDRMKQKIKRKFFGISDPCYHASAETRLALMFCDNKQFKGPNFADRLLGPVVESMKHGSEEGVGRRRFKDRIKEMGEDRYEKIFHSTFETVAGEKLQNWFRCDLSTTAAPLEGVLYVSTEKLAFCSKKPIRHGKTKGSYLKVVIPFQVLKAVNASPRGMNLYDEYMEVTSVDNQVFRFMQFLNYNDAKKCLQEVPIAGAVCSCCM